MAVIISKLLRETYQNGTKFTIGYLVHADELLDYDIPINSDASNWTGVSGTYLTRKNIKHYPPNYKVFYESVTADSGSLSGINKVTRTIKSFNISEFLLDKDFWGIHTATESDVSAKLFNIKGVACVPGDYMFPGATVSSIGAPIYDRSPFTNLSSAVSAASVYVYAGQKAMVTTYEVSFTISKDINAFETWRGVNGSFGSGMSPNTTTSLAWKAIRQQVVDGTEDKRVTRTMVLAPYISGTQLTWDYEIYGTWTW